MENKVEQKDVTSDIDISDAVVEMEKTVMELIYKAPFYANLVLNMRREFTTKVPTMGVSVTDDVNLYINPYFFSSMSMEERIDVIQHECLHVIHGHMVRARDLEPKVYEKKDKSLKDAIEDLLNASTLNQAMDYAINEYLPNLPKEMKCFDKNGKLLIHPEKDEDGNPNPKAGKPIIGKPCLVQYLKEEIPHIKNEQNMEYYYEHIKNKQEEDKKNGKGKSINVMVIDDHSIWHEGDLTDDQVKDKIREVVNKAVDQTKERNKGDIPGHLIEAIEALNHVPKDWRSDIQRFIARTSETIIDSSRKKRNRRYGITYPGNITYPKMHLALIIDCSGSVSDEELAQFFAEMCKLHKMNIKITVIEHDHDVKRVYEFDPKSKFEVKGRGGTSFKAAYEKASELDIDGIIHQTDGECGNEGVKKPKVPVLAALVGSKDRTYYPYKWASKTYIEVRKRVRA